MKLKLIAFLLILPIIGVTFLASTKSQFRVSAAGDLDIAWGVPDGDPIFVVEDILPGWTQSRTIQVFNGGDTNHIPVLKGQKIQENANLAQALTMTVLENLNLVYGPTALNQFFADPGVTLPTIPPNTSTQYTFRVDFSPQAGNEFQNGKVVFDLALGISFELPQACVGGDFPNPPIMGTAEDDSLVGTPGNDIILGLEGNDGIRGISGNDCLIGGPGNDRLIGNNGNDILIGEAGDDAAFGGNGTDTCDAESENSCEL